MSRQPGSPPSRGGAQGSEEDSAPAQLGPDSLSARVVTVTLPGGKKEEREYVEYVAALNTKYHVGPFPPPVETEHRVSERRALQEEGKRLLEQFMTHLPPDDGGCLEDRLGVVG